MPGVVTCAAAQGETPSNWEAVLWHEFCHAVTLKATANRMPRWLSEGISVYEEGLADRLVQLGIRTLNQHQQDQAQRFRVEIVPMRAGVDAMISAASRLEGPLYLSVDLDVLDPAFAPGLSHPEPGGLSTRELLSIIQAIPRGLLIGADVVELNPLNDFRDLTARVGAKVIKEIIGRLGSVKSEK